MLVRVRGFMKQSPLKIFGKYRSGGSVAQERRARVFPHPSFFAVVFSLPPSGDMAFRAAPAFWRFLEKARACRFSPEPDRKVMVPRGIERVWTEALARSLPLWHKQKKGLPERRDAL